MPGAPMDWTPLTAVADRVPRDVPVRNGTDLHHATGMGSRSNGLEFVPYVWRRGDAERDAEVAAQLAAIRAVARARRARELADARHGRSRVPG